MSLLAQPLNIKTLRLRNRVVMLPMVTNLATEDGFVTNGLIKHYAERARNDVGMVIVEATAVHPSGRNIVRCVGAWDDAFVPSLRGLAGAIKEGGAAATLQLFHAGAKTHPGLPPVSCSGVPLRAGAPGRVLGAGELLEIAADFGRAARRAVEAGFDALEVHVAHFYLLSEFLSPFTNRRDDAYGGDLAGRARLALEALAAVRREVGDDYPVLVRMHGGERVEGGMSTADVLGAARLFAKAGADGFDVSACNQASFADDEQGGYWALRPYLTREQPSGAAASQAAAIRNATGLLSIAVGKLGDPRAAERVLAEGAADLIGIGRNFLADPEVGTKMLAGRGEDIKVCKQCFLCLNTAVGKQKTVRCAINPEVGQAVD